MNRDYSTRRQAPSTSSLSGNSSNVSWGTKIKGAIQVGHGLGEAIRGSLGATDLGPHHYTSGGQIAERGRHEIAQGLARIRGVPTMLPPAPVYDRRHSYPTQQYEQRTASVWGRRSASAHHNHNPPTASSPFEKFYEHPYPAEQEQDSGFAGLGAGIDPARRKEGNDRIVPAFVVQPPQPASSSQTPYPSHTSYSARSPQVSGPYHERSIPGSQPSATPSVHSSRISPRSSIAGAPLPRNFLQPPSVGPYYGPIDNAHLSVPSPIHQTAPADSSPTGPPIPDPAPSNRRRSLSALKGRTKTNRLTKGKGKEKQSDGNHKMGRIQSMFLASGRNTVTRPQSPDHGDASNPVRYQTRSAPGTPPPHRHESALEHAGYDVLSYDVKDRYPHWPTEEERLRTQANRPRSQSGARLEPVRSVRA